MKVIQKLLWIFLGTLGLSIAFIKLTSSSVIAANSKQQNKNSENYNLPDLPTQHLGNSSKKEIAQPSQKLELSLKDAIDLALEHNRELKNAYLQRIIDRENLAEAKAIYVPRFTPRVAIDLGRDRVLSGVSTTDFGKLRLTNDLSFLVPTGGEFSITWDAGGQLETIESSDNSINQDALNQTLKLSFKQPFLRGFGTYITNIQPVQAELNEEINLLKLKTKLINIITQTIFDYRNLVQAQEGLKIQQQALNRAKEQLEITRAFIDAGRRAKVDIIQNQTQIANQELSLLAAENQLKDARSSLIQILDLEREVEIIATETLQNSHLSLAEPLDLAELLKVAFANSPDYLTALLLIEINDLDLALAKDNNRLDLNLNLEYINNLDDLNVEIGNSKVTMSLNLTKNFFGANTPERDVIRSKIQLEQSLTDLKEVKDSLSITVENNIRQVNFALQQATQARRAKELAQQQLEIEREKQKFGAGDLFQLIDFEDRLVQSQNQELNAIIDYLNTLNELQKTLGITLDIWSVKLE